MRTQWRPAGPAVFVDEINRVFDLRTIGTDTKKLAFSWEIQALEWTDTQIRTEIDKVFLAADQRAYQIPFFLHINLEWIWNKNHKIDTQMVEWINWQETPIRNWWTDWSLGSGYPTEFGPRLSFNEPSALEFIRKKSVVIKEQIKLNLQKHPESLFIGLDTGWETAITRDCKYYRTDNGVASCTGGQLPAYKSLKNLGYKESDFPNGESDFRFQAALRRISGDYIKFVTDQFAEFDKSKIFTHILLMTSGSTRAQRQPTSEASNVAAATVGYSLDGKDQAALNQVKNLTQGRPWAITESWFNEYDAAIKLSGVGLPTGLQPPKLVVIYTWDTKIYNIQTGAIIDRNFVNQMVSIVGRHTYVPKQCTYGANKYDIGTVKKEPCPTGQQGEITLTCLSDTSWARQSTCKTIEPIQCTFGSTKYDVGAIRQEACPDGEVGEVTHTCLSDKSWDSKSNCQPPGATQCIHGTDKYDISTTRREACPIGQQGEVTYTCMSDFSWSPQYDCKASKFDQCSN